ncbi:class I SAM-dependent methyltransferase [Algihabitans sp.]|uniref:class I SAM-dependent methyltransferase n=1 Tax=Algihabitans sp. TaxID=2821514 RepID=UPI003BAB17EB
MLRDKTYWAQAADAYRAEMDSSYHRNRLAMVERLLNAGDLAGRVLDFGCGDGTLSERVLAAGGGVVAIDADPSMVAFTDRRLGESEAAKTSVGGVESLKDLPNGSFDTILAVNVLAYLHGGEDAAFYQEAARLLRPDGVLLVTHSNSLFDLFTLNAFTVRFFKDNFSVLGHHCRVEALLTRPDAPDRVPQSVRENPLAYGAKMVRYDLREVRQEFAIPHALPPLLLNENPDDLANREVPDLEFLPETEVWKKMFLCSVFGSRLVKA